ncbi:unnamed protein product [Peniophora sp. CBMAI 1063]|nr:unnamed protein product [Peniophora sp. CBMAI 1063]
MASTSFDPRKHVGVGAERVTHVSSTDYPGVYPGEDHSWSLDGFRERLQVSVKRLSNRSVEFDLVGVDASIANSLRRVLIAEVPTVAIEYVYVWNNTSVMADEILAHRIGLVPLNVDPALMAVRESPELSTDRNTLVFKLHVACSVRKPEQRPTWEFDDDARFVNHTVRAGDFVWEPQGEQGEVFAERPPGPTNPDVVLMKLRPGQEIDLEMHAIKSVGKDHAKFSPVATASYRLLPAIILKKPIPREHARKFAQCFTPGVITVDEATGEVGVDPERVRAESMSREVLRHPEFEGCVELARVRDHFIFNVETESAYEPQRLPLESIRIMRDKIAALREAALSLTTPDGTEDQMAVDP